jgi:hypothetical protein
MGNNEGDDTACQKSHTYAPLRTYSMKNEPSYWGRPTMAGTNRRVLVLHAVTAAFAVGALWISAAQAATVPIPNASFESPVTDFAGPAMDRWEKAPQPIWYHDPQFPWEQLVGQFLNTAKGNPSYIDNLDGNQAAFLFALPDVAILQDYTTISDTNVAPAHEFNAQFEVGKSYTLSVGVIGGGGGMTNGATLELALYYRDAASNRVTVAATTITNSPALFPTNNHFTDFQVRIPFVKATDDWAGKRIGIRLASTVGFDLLGGYWDVDNVRLTESIVPNYSFESPATDFASPPMDGWQKAPQPIWYDDSGGFAWDQLAGQFLNPTNGSPDHLDNAEGSQGAFLFAMPDLAIFQDHTSISGTNGALAPNFNARFDVGKSYALTVGVLGGGGGMTNGATLQISLYYRDATSNKVIVAATTVTNTPALFPSKTHFTDFQVNVPAVKTNDAWAGQHIGIQLASTVGFDQLGGYWDLDNVRLTESLLANSSFESPETDFAQPAMDGWQKSPQPLWYDESSGFLWDQLMGQFLNPALGVTNRTDNMDGKQAAFLFAMPGVAIFQDYVSISGTNTTPTHDLNATFEVGKSFLLTIGVTGGGGGMSNGATLELSFYYRDPTGNKVTIAATTVTNTPALFPADPRHFTDFTVQVPTVTGREPWAGRYMGVQIASTVGFDKMGGYWDVDNVRLRAVEDPVLMNPNIAGGQFQFTVQGAPGQYAILASPNVTLPSVQWNRLGTFTNFSGNFPVTDTNDNFGRRFYQVQPAP